MSRDEKCNLALFSEKNGTLTSVFRKRFASKEFAQFELIVKEFSRLAAPHLKERPGGGSGVWRGRAGDRQLVRATTCRGRWMRGYCPPSWMCRRLCC